MFILHHIFINGIIQLPDQWNVVAIYLPAKGLALPFNKYFSQFNTCSCQEYFTWSIKRGAGGKSVAPGLQVYYVIFISQLVSSKSLLRLGFFPYFTSSYFTVMHPKQATFSVVNVLSLPKPNRRQLLFISCLCSYINSVLECRIIPDFFFFIQLFSYLFFIFLPMTI